jgi:hypothetical protein
VVNFFDSTLQKDELSYYLLGGTANVAF